MINCTATAKTGTAMILAAVTEDSIYRANEIHIEYRMEKQVLEYSVFLRNLDGLTSKLLVVSLDLIKGVNIRIGVD